MKNVRKTKWTLDAALLILTAIAVFLITVMAYSHIFAGVRAEWFNTAIQSGAESPVSRETFDDIYNTLGAEKTEVTMLDYHDALEDRLQDELYAKVFQKQAPFFITAGILLICGLGCLRQARKFGEI